MTRPDSRKQPTFERIVEMHSEGRLTSEYEMEHVGAWVRRLMEENANLKAKLEQIKTLCDSNKRGKS